MHPLAHEYDRRLRLALQMFTHHILDTTMYDIDRAVEPSPTAPAHEHDTSNELPPQHHDWMRCVAAPV